MNSFSASEDISLLLSSGVIQFLRKLQIEIIVHMEAAVYLLGLGLWPLLIDDLPLWSSWTWLHLNLLFILFLKDNRSCG